jgi:DNA-binding MarR family transcriptional regulator
MDYRDTPAVHLFGDTAPALARMRRTAEAAGCRIVSALLLDADADPGARAVPGAALLIELAAEEAGTAAIALLDRAEREARRGARRSIVSAPAGLIDLVAARTPHPDIDQLCDADEEERIAAVARAGRPVPARLHDSGRDDGAPILRQLSEDAGRIAATLAALSDEGTPAPGDGRGEPELDAATVRTLIRARRLRDQYFRSDLFADPAWDMLLDLMAARLAQNRVAVSSLCIAAAVPATTALRWIKVLTDRGLFVRVADPEDGRRVYIELSDETARALGAYLRQARRLLRAIA